jgi:hypothetical protein
MGTMIDTMERTKAGSVAYVQRLMAAVDRSIKRWYKQFYAFATILYAVFVFHLGIWQPGTLAIAGFLGLVGFNHKVWSTIVRPRLRRREAQRTFREKTNGTAFLPLESTEDLWRLKEFLVAFDITFGSVDDFFEAAKELTWGDYKIICEYDFVEWYLKVS